MVPDSLVKRGSSLVKRAVGKARVIRFTKPEWRRTRDGFWMYLDPGQFIDREIVRNGGVWEPALRSLLRRCLGPGDAFVDVGAHKGFDTCLAATLVGQSGFVLGVDPDPRAFKALSANVQRNAFAQVHLRQMALGAEQGTIELSLTNTLGNTSSFPNRIAIGDVVETIQVPVETLDRLVEESEIGSRPLPLVKIDAEGAEPLIFRGMRHVIERQRPMLALEINYASLQAAGFSVAEFKRDLARAGYTQFYEYSVKGGLSLRPTDIEVERELLLDVLVVPPNHERFAQLASRR